MPKVGGIPPSGRRSSPTDWERIAELLKGHPNEFILPDEFEDTPRVVSLANSINGNGVKVLRDLGGKIVAHQRNTRSTYANGRKGDLWVIWTPENKEE